MKKKLKILENSKKTLFLLVLTLVFVFLLKGEIVLAAEEEFPVTFTPQVSVGEFVAGEPETVTGTTLANYIDNFYKWSIRAIAIIAIIMIMVAGFQWMTAGGNASTIDQAKKRMSSALMGLILVLGAQFLLNFINPSLTVFRSLDLQPIGREELVMFSSDMNACPGGCQEDEICLFKGAGQKPECKSGKSFSDDGKIGMMWGRTILADGEVDKRGGKLKINDLEPTDRDEYDKNCGTLYCKKGPLGEAGAGFFEYPLEFYIGNKCESGKVCVIRDNRYNKDNPFFIDRDQWLRDKPVEIGKYAGAICMDPSEKPHIGPPLTTYTWECGYPWQAFPCEALPPDENNNKKWTYHDSACVLSTPKDCPEGKEQICCGSRPPWDGY